MLSKLRAVLTPQALAFLAALLLLAGMFLPQAVDEAGATALEKRIAATLSAMEGAGEVRVVITTRRAVVQTGTLAMQNQSADEVPSGVIAVAQGADDPWICAQLTQALCALLGLPASAVSVISGGG